MAQVYSRRAGHQRPCLWAGINTVPGSSLPFSSFTLSNGKPKLLHKEQYSYYSLARDFPLGCAQKALRSYPET